MVCKCSLYIFWVENEIQVIVDKTQLLLKKCINYKQKLTEAKDILIAYCMMISTSGTHEDEVQL